MDNNKNSAKPLNSLKVNKGPAISTSVKRSISKHRGSSDTFFNILIVVCLGSVYYISQDIDKRYAGETTRFSNAQNVEQSTEKSAEESTEKKTIMVSTPVAPVFVKVEKKTSVSVKPIAEIPATKESPKAIVVEKVKKEVIIETKTSLVEIPKPTKSAPVVEKIAEKHEHATKDMVKHESHSVAPIREKQTKPVVSVKIPMTNEKTVVNKAVVNKRMAQEKPTPVAVKVKPVNHANMPVSAPRFPKPEQAYRDQQAYQQQAYQRYQQQMQQQQRYQQQYQQQYQPQPQYQQQYQQPYANPYQAQPNYGPAY